MVGVPYFVISSIISLMYFEGMLSPSINTANFVSLIITLKLQKIKTSILTEKLIILDDYFVYFSERNYQKYLKWLKEKGKYV